MNEGTRLVSETTSIVNAGEFPVRIRLRGKLLAFFLACGVAFIVAGGVCVLIAVKKDWSASHINLYLLSISAFITGMITMASAWRSRLVLFEDAIEDQGLFTTHRLTRSQIGGKKVFTRQNGGYVKTIVIYPNVGSERPMKIELNFKPNKSFCAWFDSIADI